MSTLPYTYLDLIKGETNYFDLDLDVDIDAGDEIWFTAKYSVRDPDTSTVLSKTRIGGGDTEVEVLDSPNGKARIKLEPADTKTLVGRALVFDVKVKKVDAAPDAIQTAVVGTIIMHESINKDAS